LIAFHSYRDEGSTTDQSISSNSFENIRFHSPEASYLFQALRCEIWGFQTGIGENIRFERFSLEDFTTFVSYLKSKWLPDITIANVTTFLLLGEEIGVVDLCSHCSRLLQELFPTASSHHSAIAELKANVLSQSMLFGSFHRDFSHCVGQCEFPASGDSSGL
jgi:hypothetical protein